MYNKYLFLDIDGVINPQHWENMIHKMWKTSNGEIKSKDAYGLLFFDQSIKHLEYIIEETNCSLIISSTWRLEGVEKLREMWSYRDLPGIIYDITPIREDADRGKEIIAWMREFYLLKPDHKESTYSILDDRKITGHDNHFVQTNGYYGLTKSDADKVIKILNNG